MHQPVPPPVNFRVPPLIKRNTVLVALSQSFAGAGTTLAYGIGPLMVVALTGSASLAGLYVGLFGLSRFLVAYPVGKITDSYGRKPGILLGLALALIGTIVVGLSMQVRSFAMLSIGIVAFSMGMAAAYQLRVAVTDMFPPRLRGQALGYVALGSLSGLIISPLLVNAAEIVGPIVGSEVI
jgi:MFS family permease